MPSPRTIAIGLTLPCADHEKIVCRLVSAIISSAVMGPAISVVVIGRRLSRVAYVPRTAANVSAARVGAFHNTAPRSARGKVDCAASAPAEAGATRLGSEDA